MSRSLYFCFTLNNWTEPEQEQLRALILSPRVGYLVFGREVGESGTPHLQGYIEFQERLRLNQVREYLPPRAAIFVRRGNGVQASEYCKKENDFEQFGELRISQQGWHTEWHNFFNSLRQTHRPIVGGGSRETRLQ